MDGRLGPLASVRRLIARLTREHSVASRRYLLTARARDRYLSALNPVSGFKKFRVLGRVQL